MNPVVIAEDAVKALQEFTDRRVGVDVTRSFAVTAMVNADHSVTFTEDIVRSMRDSFLSVLAPELVQLPASRVTEIAQRARSLGNRTVVRVMEVLGETLAAVSPAEAILTPSIEAARLGSRSIATLSISTVARRNLA